MIDNLPDRRVLDGAVDFTMMYAAHDAFTRHLERLVATLERESSVSSSVAAGWGLFDRQLHIHHTTEDRVLWPMLRAQIADEDELTVLDAMQAEHATLDPQIERIEDELSMGRARRAQQLIAELAAGLARHMRHEENEALPLIERYLGTAGWAEFGRQIRSTQGVRGAAVYLPWVLDGASGDQARALLGILPPPVRLLYRLVWLPRYRARYG